MTPALWLSTIKSVLELLAVGVLGYLVMSYGESRVDKKDLAQLAQRIKDNGDLVAKWRKEDSDANTKRDASLASLHAAVAAHADPVIVRIPVREAGTVPANSGEASRAHPDCAGAGGGPGGAWQEINVRPDLDALKLKYGKALIDCQAALDKWPQ